jgi:hypothetical protein
MWRCQGQQDVGFDSTSSSCDESRGRSGFHRRRLTQRAEQRQRICLRVPVKYFFKVSLHGQDPEVRISEGDWQTLAQVRGWSVCSSETSLAARLLDTTSIY